MEHQQYDRLLADGYSPVNVLNDTGKYRGSRQDLYQLPNRRRIVQNQKPVTGMQWLRSSSANGACLNVDFGPSRGYPH